MKKLVFIIFSLLITVTSVAQQTPNRQTCGTFRKLSNTNNNPDYYPQYFDRFGNEYEEDELLISNIKDVEQFDCTSGYFRLHFSNKFDDKDKAVFCKVFEDFSKLIPSKNPKNLIDVLIQIGVTGTDGSGDADGDALMHATPIYSASCGIQAPIIANMIITGLPNSQPNIMYIGTIAVNKWYLDKGKFYKDELGNPNPTVPKDEYDMYYIATHEVMHLLGVASLISGNGKPINGDGFSPWDKMLFSQKINTHLITPITPSNEDLCCNRFAISPQINSSEQFNDCTDEIVFRNKNGKNIAPVSDNLTPAPYTIGALSHLQESCNGFTGPFVMHPYGKLGVRTLLSDVEKEILCELGYPVQFMGDCVADCYAVATDDKIVMLHTSGTPFTIPFSEILKNDVNVNGNPILVNIPPNVAVKNLSNGFEITTSVPGYYKIPYTITGCDGNKKCDYAYIYFLAIDPALNVDCTPVNSCELLCYGDFEKFIVGKTDNFFAQMKNQIDLYHVKNYEDNSPDIIKNTSNNNNFLQIHRAGQTYESIYLQLRHPIEPNCETFISFDGASREAFSTVRFFAFTDNILCDPITKPQATNCTNSIEQLCPKENYHCIEEVNLLKLNFPWIQDPKYKLATDLAIKFPDEAHNIIKWKNTTGKPIDKILVWIDNKTFDNFDCAFDNFSVLSSCDNNTFVVSSKIIAPLQLGATAKIEYIIQSSTPKGGPKTSIIDLNASFTPANNGITVKPNSFFDGQGNSNLTIKSGETKVVTLELEINGATNLPYSGNIFLTIQKATNACISPNSILYNTPIEITNSFSFKILDYCTKTVQFYTNPGATNHLWNFGDNTTSDESNPIHTYNSTKSTFSITHQVNGQPQNPIPVIIKFSPTYPIGPNATGANLFIPIVTNASIAVTNSLLLDLDVTFDNCVFIASPGVKIEIPQGKTVKFNNCEFYGCNQMWQAITVAGKMEMTNCPRVEDAYYAIRLYDKSEATIIGNTFSKNYVNIYAENAQLAQFTSYDNNHNSYKKYLKTPYTQNLPPKWVDTYAAYWFKNVSISSNWIIYIGSGKNLSVPGEYINGTKNGILAVNSSIYAYYVSFKNINANTFYSVGQPVQGDAVNSTANSVGKSLYVTSYLQKDGSAPLLIENTDRGIFSDNVITFVRDYGMSKIGNGIILRNSNGSEVSENTIDKCNSGGVNINNAPAKIRNNKININGANTSASGILVNNTLNSNIKDNEISLTDAAYGIRVVNSPNTTIQNNPIKILSSRKGSSTWFTDGINVTNSTKCKIANNTIKGISGNGNDPLTTPETVGIFMQNASDNDYCCNIMDNIYTGVEARNVNTISNRLKGTSFGTHNIPLWVRFSGSTISPQTHVGTTWNNIKTAAARNDNSSGNFQYYQSNRFLILPPQNNSITFPAANRIAPPDWFQPSKVGTTFECKAQLNCGLVLPIPPTLVDESYTALLQNNATKVYGEVNAWQMSKNLYSIISDDPALKKEAALLNFYEQQQNTNIATFVGIKEGLEYAARYQTQAQSDILAQKELIVEKLNNNNLFEQEKETLYTLLTNTTADLAVANEAAKKEVNKQLAVLSEKNANIQTIAIYEENLKQVNTVKINFALTNILDEKSRTILESVANQCDNTGGEAVQTARAMLESLDAKYSFGRETNDCTNIEVFSKVQKNQVNNLFIYPNPAQDQITIDKGNNDTNTLIIYAFDGRVLVKEILTNRITTINTGYLSNGVYYCRLLESNGNSPIKITIIH
jgi:hypothetical protein